MIHTPGSQRLQLLGDGDELEIDLTQGLAQWSQWCGGVCRGAFSVEWPICVLGNTAPDKVVDTGPVDELREPVAAVSQGRISQVSALIAVGHTVRRTQ